MLPLTAPPLVAEGPILVPAVSQPTARVRELVQSDYPIVWRFLRRLGIPEHDVDDAAQIVFARVLAKADRVEPGAERAHLMQTAFRFSFEYRRTKQRSLTRSSELDVELLDASALAPDEALAARRDRELLDQALDQLNPKLRAVLTLFELEGMTFTEISNVLGLARGTVASRVRKAREMFGKAVPRIQQGALP